MVNRLLIIIDNYEITILCPLVHVQLYPHEICRLVGKEVAEKQGETTVSDWRVRRHCRRALQKMFYDLNKRAC